MYKNVILSSGGFKTEGYLEELLSIMNKTNNNTVFYGSSMGAFWAVGASFGKDILIKLIINGKKYVDDVRKSWFKNLGTCKERIREILINELPEDISIIQNRCVINLTELNWKKPFLRSLQIKTYKNKKDLIDAVLGSMYVPIYSSLNFTNYFRGKLVIDGCIKESYTNINPCKILECKETKKSLFSFIKFLIPLEKKDGIILSKLNQ